MGLIVHLEEKRIIKSRKDFIEIEAVKFLIYSAFVLVPLKAPIRAYYRFTHSTPYNNVYTLCMKSQVLKIRKASRNLFCTFALRTICLQEKHQEVYEYDRKCWGRYLFMHLSIDYGLKINDKQWKKSAQNDKGCTFWYTFFLKYSAFALLSPLAPFWVCR